jgi:peptidoglycan/LPS O-acetylase OafA/YrhL
LIPRKTAQRVAKVATVAGTGGGFFIGLSRVAPLSLAILGATVVVVVLVLAFTSYKLIDRLLQHVERASSDRSMVEALSSKAPQQQESPGT